ncbi:MAG: hypothetical protein ABI729_07890 [Chitinophagales bacterium]
MIGRIVIYVGLFLSLLTIGFNFYSLINYSNSHQVIDAYSNRAYIVYIFLPLTLIDLFFLIASFANKKLPVILRRVYLLLFILCIMSEFFIDRYLQCEVNKVPILINNLSPQPLNDIHIKARNNQNLWLKEVPSGHAEITYCDCRDVNVSSNDSIGLLISYSMNNNIKVLDLIGAYQNLFDDTVEVRIINDSISFLSQDYGNEILWKKIGSSNGLLPWDIIKKTLPNQTQENNY